MGPMRHAIILVAMSYKAIRILCVCVGVCPHIYDILRTKILILIAKWAHDATISKILVLWLRLEMG